MNQYDPMKDSSTGNDTDRQSAAENTDHTNTQDTYRATDDTYSAADAADAAADADGRKYTNPDGSHGFVYNERARAAETRSRRYRGALIAVSVVLLTVLLAIGCFVGAMMALRSLQDSGNQSATDPSGVGEAGTKDDLEIVEGTSVGSEHESGSAGSSGSSNNYLTENMGATVPDSASITKLKPKRPDQNGDGKADIVLDANGQVVTSAGTNAVSVATVVARVADSVVEIKTETISQSGFGGQQVSAGAGSGVIISKEGFIVTNHHVIDGAGTIMVRLTDGTEYPATLIGTDEQTDVAVLWIDPAGRELTVATLGASYDLVVGEDILAIGNPLGSLGGTVTEGMISATARDISVGGTKMTLLQVSAPINPGNSGGGLFNLAGELIGVVNAKVSSEEIEGLGFAIPIDTAYDVILELIDHGYVHGRPALGVTLVEVSSWGGSRYVCVSDRTHSVLQYEDIILAVDGVTVDSIAEVNAAIRKKAVGDTVELIIYRDQKQTTVLVTVAEDIPASAAD